MQKQASMIKIDRNKTDIIKLIDALHKDGFYVSNQIYNGSIYLKRIFPFYDEHIFLQKFEKYATKIEESTTYLDMSYYEEMKSEWSYPIKSIEFRASAFYNNYYDEDEVQIICQDLLRKFVPEEFLDKSNAVYYFDETCDSWKYKFSKKEISKILYKCGSKEKDFLNLFKKKFKYSYTDIFNALKTENIIILEDLRQKYPEVTEKIFRIIQTHPLIINYISEHECKKENVFTDKEKKDIILTYLETICKSQDFKPIPIEEFFV